MHSFIHTVLNSAAKRFHNQNMNPPGFCFAFQDRKCNMQDSYRHHACAGCNTANVPYVDCLGLETA